MPLRAQVVRTIAQIHDRGDGPHRVASLVADGLGRQRVRTAIDVGALMVLRRGIVIPSEAWQTACLVDRRLWAMQAALLAYPAGYGSHDSASRFHVLPDFGMPRDDGDIIPRTHITRLGAGRNEDWLRVHGCDTPPEWVVDVNGVRVTGLVRTSIEVAATRSLRAAVVVIDAAMRSAISEGVPAAALRQAVQDPATVSMARLRWRHAVGAYARHRWVTSVRRAVELADPAAESVLESLSRVAMVEHELPTPHCGVPIAGDDGRTYWADFYWHGAGLVGEADGLGKYADHEAFLAEKRRREALEGRGLRVVRWGWEHVHPDPAVMVARVRTALAQPPTRPRWLA